MTSKAKSDDDAIDTPRSKAGGAEKAQADPPRADDPKPEAPPIQEFPRMVYRATEGGTAEGRLVNSAQDLEQLQQSSGSHWADSPAKVEKPHGQ